MAVERGGGGGGGLRRAVHRQCACHPAGPAVQRPTGAALISVTPVLVACLRLLTCAVHPAAARSSCQSISVDTSLRSVLHTAAGWGGLARGNKTHFRLQLQNKRQVQLTF